MRRPNSFRDALLKQLAQKRQERENDPQVIEEIDSSSSASPVGVKRGKYRQDEIESSSPAPMSPNLPITTLAIENVFGQKIE